MTSKIYKLLIAISLVIATFFIISVQTSCGVYRFKDVSIPDSVKFVKVNQFQNRATYINPRLAPELTEKLRQKIQSQTRIGMTNGDDADWIIDCTITSYTIATSGISNQQASTNRLNVGVNVKVRNGKTQKEIGKYDVSTPFEYKGALSLQQAEQGLQAQMLRDVTDAVFNRIFSNW